MRLFLAMTHHRLGHQDVARQGLDQAIRQMERDADHANPAPPSWDEQVRRQLLRREAEALILGQEPSSGRLWP